MKYLGLDVGKKTIGVAVGEVLAAELTTLRAGKEETFYTEPAKSRSFKDLRTILEEEKADAVVVGLPVTEDGRPTEESKLIDQYASELEAALEVSVLKVDETLTSFMAEDMLQSQGLDLSVVEKRRDQLAAQLILQQYLEEHETL